MKKKYQIKNGLVFTEDGEFRQESVYLVDQRIVTEQEYQNWIGEDTIIEAEDCYVIPGLTDIHFHGCVGVDCCDGTIEAFTKMAEYQAKQGVTTITPATMTMPEEILLQIAETAAEYPNQEGAVFCGLYMEGPFISYEKKGAQNEAYIRKPDVKLLERLQAVSGQRIRTVVVAPEIEGAMEFISALDGKINLSIAHTNADYEVASEAMDRGVRQMTHLYNAMPSYHHRAPGPIGAAAERSDIRAELICDGIHVHPAVVRSTFQLFGDDRIIMISDSMSAAGMEDGEYALGGQKVIVKGSLAVLEDGTLAGSATNLMDCLRTAVKQMQIPLTSAIKCAAVNPAKAIGIYDQFGSLTPGKYANLVILDQDLAIRHVICRGNMVVG